MGHEYVQLKESTAAFKAYRKAVDINPRDYRAWYALGHTYEILKMPLYALYYFRKACKLRPFDARMWCAMGECYALVGNVDEAIKSYERALSSEDREGTALQKLAQVISYFPQLTIRFSKALEMQYLHLSIIKKASIGGT